MSDCLSSQLLKKLKRTLTRLSAFSSDRDLSAQLIVRSVGIWRDGVPSATDPAQRVDLAIQYFLSKTNEENENGLVLLLQVLADGIDPSDANHSALIRLSREVQQELQQPDITAPPALPHPTPPPPPIAFVNREEELRSIRQTTTVSQKFWVIDGPAGYGKSTFLHRIQEVYESEGWPCVYLPLDKDHPSDIYSIAAQLAERIGRPITRNGHIAKSLGTQIAHGLLKYPVKRKGKKLSYLQEASHKGAVLLIDNLESLENPVFSELADLLTGINDGLETTGFYGKHNKLFVFLAGRDIRRRSTAAFRSKNFQCAELPLSPYTFNYIQETVQKYAYQCGAQLNSARIAQISARLMYLNGGHPGLTANVLSELKETNFTDTTVWLERPPNEEFDDRLRDLTNAVLDSFGSDVPKLLPILETLSIFRRYGTWLFRDLIRLEYLKWEGGDFRALEQKLIFEFLLRRSEHGIIHDSITQRLLNIKLRFQDKARFQELCQVGMTLYMDRICKAETKTRHPEYWAAEHVYLSSLHAYYSEDRHGESLRYMIVRTIEENKRILETSWDPGTGQDFIELLTGDWELEFFVNFFLSDQNYQADHYQRILQECRQDAVQTQVS